MGECFSPPTQLHIAQLPLTKIGNHQCSYEYKEKGPPKRATTVLRGSLPKSVPLDFGLDKTFALYFYHQYHYPS